MNNCRLNNRVTIQRFVEYEDENGITKSLWEDFKTVWCSINNLYGDEYWTAKEYNAENTVEFVIRYNACKDLSVNCHRLKYMDRLFNITFIDNIQYRNEVLKIKALEVVSGGTERLG